MLFCNSCLDCLWERQQMGAYGALTPFGDSVSNNKGHATALIITIATTY